MKPLLLLSLVVLTLSGCASVAPGSQPVAKLDPAKLGLVQNAITWPEAGWWQRYNDPQLNALVDEAVVGSPSIARAQARLDKANAAIQRSGSALLPRLDADYTLTREHIPTTYIYPAPLGGSVQTDNRLALDFSYELDFWGKNRALLNSAVEQSAASKVDAQAARIMLAGAVVKAYLNLQDAFAQHQVLEDVIKQRDNVISITNGRFRAGLDTQVEVKQAESALAAARVELTQLETRTAQLRNQISALAGAGPDRGHSLLPAKLTVPANEIPTSIPLELLSRRPDVVAALWRAEAANQDITAARAMFYPNVNLNAFVGAQTLGVSALFKSGSFTSGVGPAISLPIFHGGALNANLADKKADANLAIADYNQTVLDAVQQVADALDAIRMLGREAQEQRAARDAIDAAYSLALSRYKEGLGNYLTVLVAQDSVMTQALRDTDIHMRAYQLDADLARALGGGFAPAPATATAKNPAQNSPK
jgi:NodT family efflux transporter outer membrane factor (OMF) lipoprotein